MQIVDIHSRVGTAQVIVEDMTCFTQRIWLKQHRFREDRLLEYIYWHYKSRIFVDVGSNIGNHTLFFAKFCQPHHTISIEPYAPSVALQRAILKRNDVANRVTIHQCAVSDHPHRASLATLNPRYRTETMALTEGDDVEVTTLDLLLSDIKHINLVKIDVEPNGQEIKVLQGALNFLSRQHPALFIEIRRGCDLIAVKDILIPLNYTQKGSLFQDATVYEFT